LSLVSHDPKQLHVALIYRTEGGEHNLIHLGWHHQLRHEPWNNEYHWVGVQGIDEEVQETFADWAIIVSTKACEHPIPYSIIFSPDRTFDTSGQFISGTDGRGLTCATFLLALFSDFSIPIADRETWPAGREVDVAWADRILKALEDYLEKRFPDYRPQWLLQHEQRRMLRRYRPEEVAACGHHYRGTPVHFDVASRSGADFCRKLRSV
jgi:hypothetical protein